MAPSFFSMVTEDGKYILVPIKNIERIVIDIDDPRLSCLVTSFPNAIVDGKETFYLTLPNESLTDAEERLERASFIINSARYSS